MNGQDFRSSVRSIDGDWWGNCGAQTGAGRIARLKAVPPAAWVRVERAVLLDLEQCRVVGSVRGVPAKWQIPSRSLARRRLDCHASV